MDPPVTVVIPIYNGLPFVFEAIDSVFKQNHNSWQLLLVDDCSVDGSREALARFESPSVRAVYNQKNLGLYGTLTGILPSCASEWITILMQDDRLKRGHLEQMLELAARYPDAEAIWAGEDLINGEGNLLRKGAEVDRAELIEPGIDAWKGCLRRGCIWTISGSFTRRGLFCNVPFRDDLPHCGDYDWLLRAIRISRFLYFERPLTEIRIHDRQASAKHLHEDRDVKEAYQILRSNIAAHGHDLCWRDLTRILARRSMLTGRRSLVALARGRIDHGWLLANYTFRFLRLATMAER